MEYSEFKRHVNKAELEASQNFSQYKTKVALFAMLGYVVILALILGISILLGGLVWAAVASTALLILLVKKKIIFLLIPMLWVMIRSLWVKIEEPIGYELTRGRFPELFNVLDELSRELNSLKVHKVLLTQEMNAAVVQSPRLGMLGWQKNTLILGLELLLALNAEQARSVIAHELGHLSGNHSKFNGWIYRVRESWSRILYSLANEDNFGSRVLTKFFNWYAPRFQAYSFPLARFNEFEADSISAKLTSPKSAAEALINVHVVSPYLDDRYWKTFFKRADTQKKPKTLPWEGLHLFLQTNKDDKIDARLKDALNIETDVTDTHPSLKDRLSALDVVAELPTYSDQNAAHQWLGDKAESVIKEFDRLWFKDNHAQWLERFNYATKSKDELKKLRSHEVASLSSEQLWELATLENEFGKRSTALNAFREYYKANPSSAKGAFAIGYFMYENDQEACLQFFEKALTSDEYALDACNYAYQLLFSKGKTTEAEKWLTKAEGVQNALQEQYVERQQLNVHDEMIIPNTQNEYITMIINRLKISKRIKSAWIVEKVLTKSDGQPAIAVAVKVKGFAISEHGVHEKLSTEFEDLNIWVIPHLGEYKPLAKAIMAAGEKVV